MSRFKARFSGENPDNAATNLVFEVEAISVENQAGACDDMVTGYEGLLNAGIIPGVTHTSGQIAEALGIDTAANDTGSDPLAGDGDALREREASRQEDDGA